MGYKNKLNMISDTEPIRLPFARHWRVLPIDSAKALDSLNQRH
jgi:hypothetical protein